MDKTDIPIKFQLDHVRHPLMVYVMGTTNVGKTTFLGESQKKGRRHIFGTIMVGKEMRRRYPPEHFKGLGAMESTEQEAMDIFHEQLNDCKAAGKEIILVDGQPRTLNQVAMTEALPKRLYLFLTEEEDTIKERMVERAAGNQAELDMSISRFGNDKKMLYDVLMCLIQRDTSPIWSINMAKWEKSYGAENKYGTLLSQLIQYNESLPYRHHA